MPCTEWCTASNSVYNTGANMIAYVILMDVYHRSSASITSDTLLSTSKALEMAKTIS